MNLPIYDNGVAAGLLIGVLFGFVLEGAGFGSPRKLTAQFRFSDWAVFKVMMTAVTVAAVGLWLVEASGLIGTNAVFVPTLFLWAVALGGVFIGAGFALGGYCPGTSAVGLASGRGDAGIFILGMIAGTWMFATLFEPLREFYMAAEGPKGQTISNLLGLPDWLVLIGLILLAFAGWQLGSRLEKRLGGPVSADDLFGSTEHTNAPRNRFE